MTPAPIRPRLSLLDALAPPDQFHSTVTLRSLPALIDQNNQLAGLAAEQVRATEELGRAVGAGMARLATAQVAAAGVVGGAVERLRAEVRAATGTLDDIREEVEQARRVQEEQLAVQQEALDLQRRSLALQQGLLKSDNLQGRVEEFLYQFKKAVERYGVDSTEYPAPIRLLLLRGFLGEIAEQNIATPMIRGITNKGLFDDALSQAQRLVRELSAHPDVLAALDWAKREQRRAEEEEERKRREQEAEEQRSKEEAERRRREREAEERRRQESEEERQRQLSALRAKEADLKKQATGIEKEIGKKEQTLTTSYGRWFLTRFGFDHNTLMAVLVLLSLGSCCGAPASLLVFGGGPKFGGKTDPAVPGKEEVKLGDKLFGMLCFFGVPGPLAVLGVVYLISAAMHRRAVDVAQDQAELDRTVNAEALAEIARLKESLVPVNERLAEVQKETELLKAGPAP